MEFLLVWDVLLLPPIGLELALDLILLGEPSFATHFAHFATFSDSVWSDTLNS